MTHPVFLRWKQWLREAEDFLLEKGLVKTFWDLMVRPQKVVAGSEVYLSPWKYTLVVVGLSYLLTSIADFFQYHAPPDHAWPERIKELSDFQNNYEEQFAPFRLTLGIAMVLVPCLLIFFRLKGKILWTITLYLIGNVVFCYNLFYPFDDNLSGAIKFISLGYGLYFMIRVFGVNTRVVVFAIITVVATSFTYLNFIQPLEIFVAQKVRNGDRLFFKAPAVTVPLSSFDVQVNIGWYQNLINKDMDRKC